MASGQEIHPQDLPPELKVSEEVVSHGDDWEGSLRRWAEQRLSHGDHDLLADALPCFERVLIETALKHTAGRRQDAAKLLGWGRNTLTRKIKELDME